MAAQQDVEAADDAQASRSFDVGAAGGGAREVSLLESNSDLKNRLDKLTTLAVNLATFAYLPLQVPQIVKNFRATPEEVRLLSWQGLTAGALGNLLLATYFAGQAEWAAVRVQIIGSATNFAVIVQIWAAGGLDPVIFWGLLVIMSVGLLLPSLKGLGLFPDAAFAKWSEGSTVLGAGALLFSITATFTHEEAVTLGVAAAGAAAMAALVARPPAALRSLLATLSGWLATLLFMFFPCPQILQNLKDPLSAHSFSMGFVILGTIGNGLCMSRALFVKDAIWFTGASWGTIIGAWVTTITVYMAGYVSLVVLVAYSVGLYLYFAVLLLLNGKAHGESLLQQLAFLAK